MATLADLRTSVSAKLGMDDTAGGSDEQLIDGWVTQGVREVLMRTHCHVNCADLTLSADTWKYDLPSSILAIHNVVDSQSNPAIPVDFQDILDLRRAQSTSVANTQLRYTVLGSNLLCLWPTPSAADTIDLFYVPSPGVMTDGDDNPATSTFGGIPVEFHYAIELWALAQGSDHEHEGRTQSGVKYAQEFELYIARVVRPAVNRKQGRRGQARVGRRPLIRSGNGIYPSY